MSLMPTRPPTHLIRPINDFHSPTVPQTIIYMALLVTPTITSLNRYLFIFNPPSSHMGYYTRPLPPCSSQGWLINYIAAFLLQLVTPAVIQFNHSNVSASYTQKMRLIIYISTCQSLTLFYGHPPLDMRIKLDSTYQPSHTV